MKQLNVLGVFVVAICLTLNLGCTENETFPPVADVSHGGDGSDDASVQNDGATAADTGISDVGVSDAGDASGDASVTDVGDAGGDGGCVPNCSGRLCGAPDGCGGWCAGVCPNAGEVCDPSDFQCKLITCVPCTGLNIPNVGQYDLYCDALSYGGPGCTAHNWGSYSVPAGSGLGASLPMGVFTLECYRDAERIIPFAPASCAGKNWSYNFGCDLDNGKMGCSCDGSCASALQPVCVYDADCVTRPGLAKQCDRVGDQCLYDVCFADADCADREGTTKKCLTNAQGGHFCQYDLICTPGCAGAACGASDGCNGQCVGACGPGYACNSTTFVCECPSKVECDNTCCATAEAVCVNNACCSPVCSGKACGDDDGCGGRCGAGSCVLPNAVCNPQTFACDCTPSDCAGAVCGADNGCGGLCQGTCLGPQDVCNAGQCQCQPNCANVCGGADGCGGACPDNCVAPETCSGGGSQNVCGCTADCPIGVCGGPDSCGGTCPDNCVAPMTCGGGGPQNVCGCTPNCAGVCGGADGCGGVCPDNCTAPQTCSGGGTANVCGCTPSTCQAQGRNCDSIPDGCGGTLNCGACVNGESCNNGTCSCVSAKVCGGTCCGQSSDVCHSGACCSPISQAVACNNACGTVSDGCGGTHDCGGCSNGRACQNNACVCVSGVTCSGDCCAGATDVCNGNACCAPTTCQAQNVHCGSVSDECGNTLNCGACQGQDVCVGGSCCTPVCTGKCGGADGCGGTCPNNCVAPETCGGSGTVDVCGCTPNCTGVCGGADGCGGTCPDNCVAPQTCGGGGTVNVCGCVPTPQVTVCAGKCGILPDGCGGSYDCGGCVLPQTCGGGATANVCGCTINCTGATCGAADGCGGLCQGTCPGPQDVCNPQTFVCDCVPNCAGKNCGTDGCVGNCGTCNAPSFCGANGICVVKLLTQMVPGKFTVVYETWDGAGTSLGTVDLSTCDQACRNQPRALPAGTRTLECYTDLQKQTTIACNSATNEDNANMSGAYRLVVGGDLLVLGDLDQLPAGQGVRDGLGNLIITQHPNCLTSGDCEDNDSCTVNVCQSGGTCYFQHTNADCNDQNPGTTDTCVSPGNCSNVPTPACLVDGDCAVPPDACLDPGTCNTVTGQCNYPAKVCSDGVALTLDRCDPAIGCVFVPVECVVNGDCNDNKPLTTDTCVAGNTCQPVFACPVMEALPSASVAYVVGYDEKTPTNSTRVDRPGAGWVGWVHFDSACSLICYDGNGNPIACDDCYGLYPTPWWTTGCSDIVSDTLVTVPGCAMDHACYGTPAPTVHDPAVDPRP